MAKKEENAVKEGNTADMIREDVYPVEELIMASRKVFKVPQECAVAALKPLKKETMAVSEAKAAIEMFMKKEAK